METKKTILSLVILFASIALFSQNTSKDDFRNEEDSIKGLFKIILKTRTDDLKTKYSLKLDSLFGTILRQPGSFEYPFDSLQSVGRIYAPDHTFRIINWNIPFEDGTYKYYGYIQTSNSKSNSFNLFHLNDQKEKINNPENVLLNANKWYGALYYNIIKQKSENEIYYSLLALQYYNVNLSRKIIEILSFDESGNPVFGAPIFQVENQTKYRIVFQYAAQVAMNLRYDKKLKMIIFDHLSPSEQRYTGEYEYYGPDLSFDGFEFVNNRWVFRSNLDLRQNSDNKH